MNKQVTINKFKPLIYQIKEYIEKNIYKDSNYIYEPIYKIDTEKAYKDIVKSNIHQEFALIDEYGGFRGKFNKIEFIVPNTYGEENNWDDEFDNYNFIIVTKNKTIIFEHNGEIGKDNIEEVSHNDINLEQIMGKRGYYLYKDYILIRTNKIYYDTFDQCLKNIETEEWCSGPYIKIKRNNQ